MRQIWFCCYSTTFSAESVNYWLHRIGLFIFCALEYVLNKNLSSTNLNHYNLPDIMARHSQLQLEQPLQLLVTSSHCFKRMLIVSCLMRTIDCMAWVSSGFVKLAGTLPCKEHRQCTRHQPQHAHLDQATMRDMSEKFPRLEMHLPERAHWSTPSGQ